MDIQSVLRQVIELLSTLLDDGGPTFGEFLVSWYEKYKKPKLKASTLYDMERYVGQLKASEFGFVPLRSLDGERLQDYLIKNYKGNTRKKVYLVLHGCLDKAVRLRKISYNPLLSVELPAHRAKHYRPLEFDEQNRIVYYYEHPREYFVWLSNIPAYYAVFRFMCCTGLRIGEFLALDYAEDIDTDEYIITVRRNKNSRTGEIVTPKTITSERRIPFLPELLPTIAELKTARFTYESIKQHFERVYKRLGIVGANIHTFRHTFVSMCYAAGVPAKNIQNMVGHAEIGTTLNIYTHILKKGTSPLYEYIKRLKGVTC